ncbi:3-deoxy-manno-octulosonate cytidylyltransferase [Rhodobacteraceae bacterium CCMM004]|nr:3-deoxy-manno-octulosonate cytidylyltransferase [Rhodobacteraceae bacterium CCMM004]
MTVAILIPARYASSRFPGKPLVPLAGADGGEKSLIRRTWEAGCRVEGAAAVHILTDDDRIAAHAQGFGASVLMTSERPRNGTERCAEALDQLDPMPDLVVNLQGDSPLTPPWFIEALIDAMAEDRTAAMATPVLPCDGETLENFRVDRRDGRLGSTVAVTRPDGTAADFTKRALPDLTGGGGGYWHHVGVYAYRPDALRLYRSWDEGVLERREGLEQLRFLENGAEVRCVPVEARGHAFWEVNNPVDVERVERLLARDGIL